MIYRSVLVTVLRALPDEQLLAVLRAVFATRQPNPEEQEWSQNSFFLGTASRVRRDDATAGAVCPDTAWEPWQIAAVAYPDSTTYGQSDGPTWGFCQGGMCQQCSTEVRSNVKHAQCPICGAPVYLS